MGHRKQAPTSWRLQQGRLTRLPSSASASRYVVIPKAPHGSGLRVLNTLPRTLLGLYRDEENKRKTIGIIGIIQGLQGNNTYRVPGSTEVLLTEDPGPVETYGGSY